MSSTESIATPALPDVALDARVIAVVAPVGGQVERHRQAHLPGGQVAPVEGVRLLGGGEAGVLADRPRPVGVHGRPHAPGERGEAGQRVEPLDAPQVAGRVERLDVDALGRLPHQGLGIGALQVLGRQRAPVVECRLLARLLARLAHAAKPRGGCRSARSPARDLTSPDRDVARSCDRRRSAGVSESNRPRPCLSVVIPCFNEVTTVETVVGRCSPRPGRPRCSSSTTGRPTAPARCWPGPVRPTRAGHPAAREPGQGRGPAPGLRRGHRRLRPRAGRRPRVRPRRVRRPGAAARGGPGRRGLRLALHLQPRPTASSTTGTRSATGSSRRCPTCSPT